MGMRSSQATGGWQCGGDCGAAATGLAQKPLH